MKWISNEMEWIKELWWTLNGIKRRKKCVIFVVSCKKLLSREIREKKRIRIDADCNINCFPCIKLNFIIFPSIIRDIRKKFRLLLFVIFILCVCCFLFEFKAFYRFLIQIFLVLRCCAQCALTKKNESQYFRQTPIFHSFPMKYFVCWKGEVQRWNCCCGSF